MKYNFKKLPDSIVEVEVISENQEFLNFWQPVYDKALSQVNLKGFRPGTAPKDLADKAIDKEKVFEEAVNNAIKANLKSILEENNWQLIDQPKVEVLESDPVANKDLKFKLILTVFPEIKLGNYQKISKRISGTSQKNFSVSEEELQKSINWILSSRAKLTRVNREAKKGDVVDVDFVGFSDGKQLDGASGKADNFVLGEGKFVPGFEDNIIGHKEKDHLEFSVEFPVDYWKKEMSAKKVDFKVDIHGVFERQLPELTDEFIKGLGKFENVAGFKKSVKEGMEKEKEQKEKEKLRLKILEEIIKDSKIEMSKVMLERTLNNMVEDYKSWANKIGAKDISKQEDDAEIRKHLEDKARNSVVTNLVLYQIAKEQNLEPTHEEVEKEVNHFLSRSEFSRQPKVDSQKVYDYIYGEIKNKKVFEYLELFK